MENMENSTFLRQFHLTAIFSSSKAQIALFVCVLLMYLLTVAGNQIIILLVCTVSQLHTPMYFFLCNLSVQDIVYVSTILPKLLAITITGDTSISFLGCVTQLFMFAFCINTEFYLLTSMAYDRFVAICIALCYSLIMKSKVCAILATASWLVAFLNSMMFSGKMTTLSFCNVQEINHFYCDVQTMLKLSCSDNTDIRTYIAVDGALLGWIHFILIMISYIFIISTILKIRTSAGRFKAFSSCSSHLMVVLLFYGTCLVLNMNPESIKSHELDKILSLIYIAIVPMLNPPVYSLRNKEVLKVMKKCLKML